jgi:hypothetical protein
MAWWEQLILSAPERKARRDVEALEANRQQLLGMTTPVQAPDLISAITESMERAGKPMDLASVLALQKSAGAQELGQRRLFTPEPTLMSRGLPYITPEFKPTQAGLQTEIETARMPQSQVRLLEALTIAKAIKAAKETTRGQYVKTDKGGLQWRNVDESGNIPLQKGDIPVGTDISQTEWTGGAMTEVQIMNGLKMVDTQAMKHAVNYVKQKYGGSDIDMSIDANGNSSLVIGRKTDPKQLGDYQREYAAFGKRFSSQLHPKINKMFLGLQEPGKGLPEAPKTDQQTINDILADKMFDPKIKAQIQAAIAAKHSPAEIIGFLRERQLIK